MDSQSKIWEVLENNLNNQKNRSLQKILRTNLLRETNCTSLQSQMLSSRNIEVNIWITEEDKIFQKDPFNNDT
jgi:hypothetical protein